MLGGRGWGAGYYSRIAALRGLLAQFLRATAPPAAPPAASEADSARAAALAGAAREHSISGQDPPRQPCSARHPAEAEDPVSGSAAPAYSALTEYQRQQTASGTRDRQFESHGGSGRDPVSEAGTSGSAAVGGAPQRLRPPSDGASGREPAARQVLSLGAGFDTTWFHFKVRSSECDGWALMTGTRIRISSIPERTPLHVRPQRALRSSTVLDC